MGFAKHMGRLLVLGLSKVRLVNFGDLELVGEGTVPIGEIEENIRRQAGLLRVARRSNRA